MGESLLYFALWIGMVFGGAVQWFNIAHEYSPWNAILFVPLYPLFFAIVKLATRSKP